MRYAALRSTSNLLISQRGERVAEPAWHVTTKQLCEGGVIHTGEAATDPRCAECVAVPTKSFLRITRKQNIVLINAGIILKAKGSLIYF